MANQTIVFDPTAGVPVGANLTIYGGSALTADFNIVDTASTAYDLSGFTGSSQMAKSVSVGATLGSQATFTVGFTSAADGKIRVSYGATQTGALTEGRYVYDVLISTGSTVYNIINGNVYVYAGISSSPGSV
tara:strand:+ start:26 stop:421 length:396 start_codon:yes stop_codon:yes gene_type:complete